MKQKTVFSKILNKAVSLILICYKKTIQVLLYPVLKREYRKPYFSEFNERAVEYAFVFRCLWQNCPLSVLDVGPGSSALPHMMSNCGFAVTAVDEKKSYWKTKYVNRHYLVLKDDIINPELKSRFDAVTCVSVLEHIPKHAAAIDSMLNLLNPGGHLILTVPYSNKGYIDNVYSLEGAGYGQNAPYVCQVFSEKEIKLWTEPEICRIQAIEYYRIFEGELWTFGKRLKPPRKVELSENPQLVCIDIIKNGE